MRELAIRILSRRNRRVVAYSIFALMLALIGLALIEAGSSSALKPRNPGHLRAIAGDGSESIEVTQSKYDTPDRSGSLINRVWAGALDDARGRLEEQLGVFAYQPGGESVESNPWVRPEALQQMPARGVLLIHGLDDSGAIWDDMAPALAADGHSVLRFDYPNDQSIARSAVRLVQELGQLRTLGVEHVDLVCHSMGGLVSREALTHPSGYAGTGRGREDLPVVDRLIMVGTPQYGSELARFRAVMEIRDQFVRLSEREELRPVDLLSFLVDGDGQAGRDLLPGSAFLERLNSRPLPKDVRLTLVVGRAGAKGSEVQHGPLIDPSLLERALGKSAASHVTSWFDEQLRTIGDGAVSTRSAELEGVGDVVYLAAAHRTLLRRMPALGQDADPPAIQVVRDRLESARTDEELPRTGQ